MAGDNGNDSGRVVFSRGSWVTERELLEQAGFAAAVPVPGLLVPLWDLKGEVNGALYYPEGPRMGSSGPRVVEVARGVRVALDCAPDRRPKLRDAGTLWVCDDMRVSAAIDAAGGVAVTVVGPLTTKGRPRYDAAPGLADWELVALGQGRQVVLAWHGQDDTTGQAAERLAAALRFRGAVVARLKIPFNETITGYLEAHTLADLQGWSTPVVPQEREKGGGALPQLLQLLELCTLIRTPSHDTYAVVPLDHEQWLTVPLGERGAGLKHWLIQAYQLLGDNPEHLPPPTTALTRALDSAMALAHFLPPTTRVWSRVGSSDDGGIIYIDSCGDTPTIAISADGVGTVPPGGTPPALFRRSRGQLALPPPAAQGGDIRDLRPFLNVVANTDDELLVWGWLVGCLLPNGPYPLLCLHGPQGSAKSTATRLLRSLIDPHEVPLRGMPKDPEALMLAAQNGAVVCLENLSSMPLWLSDALCTLATGGGLSRRELYGEEEKLFLAKKPVILNGIVELSSRGDLRERSIFITLQRLAEQNRQAERDYWLAWQAVQPRVLAALYDAASFALATVDSLELPGLPRMADFARWCYAAMAAFGVAPQRWLEAYARNQEASIAIELEQSPLASLLLKYLEQHTITEESAADILRHLHDWFRYENQSIPDNFPKTADSLGKTLKRLEVLLSQSGWELSMGRSMHARWYSLQRKTLDE